MDLTAKDDSIVVVTGASGFVGSYIVRELLQLGYRVRATVRNAKDERKTKFLRDLVPDAKHPLELFSADLTTPGMYVCLYVCMSGMWSEACLMCMQDRTTRL